MDSPQTSGASSPQTVAVRLCQGGMVLALALLVAGLIWGRVAANSPQMLWSPEQAAEFQAANDALHNVEHAHTAPAGDGGHDHQSPEVAAARARVDALQVQLDRAQYAQTRLGPLLTRIGLAAAIAFGIGYLASRA